MTARELSAGLISAPAIAGPPYLTDDPEPVELGVKYRFVDEGERRPQGGTFPLLELPTGSAAHGLGFGKVVTVPLGRGAAEVRIDLGLVFDFSELHHLLLSAGPAFGADAGAQGYVLTS